MPDNPDTEAIDELWNTLQRSAESSLVVTLGSTVLDPFRHTTSRLITFTRESYLFRWLTKEPDPDVIVIDLRETYTVGPIIRIIDAVITRVEPYWRDSTFKRFVDWSNRQLQRGAATRTGRVVRAVLEPPEPPEKKDQD